MSINSLFETTRRSFRTLDGLMNTTGQNIANAETEGYARRRVTLASENTVGGLQTRLPAMTPNGIGVSIATFERVRDTLLQRSAWTQQGELGAAEEEHRVMTALEGVFPAGEGSLQETLNAFWNAWSDLSDAPTSDSARFAVQRTGADLATTFRRIDTDLLELERETADALTVHVEKANDLLKGVAELNATIRAARHSGTPDYAAEDRRDGILKELAGLLPVRVETGEDYNVSVGGVTVVEGAGADQIVIGTGTPPTLTFENANLPLRTGSADGAVGALYRTLTGAFPDTRARLDALAGELVTAVNALHEPRYDDTGAAVLPDAPPFFDPAGTTAATLALSPAVAADAGLVGTPGFFTAAGEEIAFAIAGLRTADLPGLGASSEHAAIDLVSEVGGRVASAQSRATSAAAVVEHLDAMERGISGVSVDDELASLIRYQQAYGAAARVLTTARDMMDTLLAM